MSRAEVPSTSKENMNTLTRVLVQPRSSEIIELQFNQLELWFNFNSIKGDNLKYSCVVAIIEPLLTQPVFEIVSHSPGNKV